MRQNFIMMLKGFCMGTADIIPGVSGGTMAYILGIYDKLIAALCSFDKEALQLLLKGNVKAAIAKPHWHIVLPLIVGMGCAILFFTKIIALPQLIIDYPEHIYGLFFGLIIGSALLLLAEARMRTLKDLGLLISGVAFGYMVLTLSPQTTPDTSWFIFLCGMMAISVMLLPGISGSYLLLMLGKYILILQAISSFNLAILLPFIGGMAVGLILFSRIIHWLLKHYHRATLLFITGLLVGSLRVLWPFQERIYSTIRGKQKLVSTSPVFPEADYPALWEVGAFMLAGILVVLTIQRIAKQA